MSVTLPAIATADEGFYVNVGVGQVSADVDFEEIDVQGTSVDLGSESLTATMATGRVGYQLNDYFAVEAEAGFGLDGDDIQRTVPVDTGIIGTVNVDVDGSIEIKNYYGVFARGIFPVSDTFDIFGRIGYGSVEVEADATGTLAGLGSVSASESTSESDFAYGLGAEFSFGAASQHGLRFDASAISDGEFFGLSYRYRF